MTFGFVPTWNKKKFALNNERVKKASPYSHFTDGQVGLPQIGQQ